MAGPASFDGEDSLEALRARYSQARAGVGWGRLAVAAFGAAGVGFAVFVFAGPYRRVSDELARRSGDLAAERATLAERTQERDKLKEQAAGPAANPARALVLARFHSAVSVMETALRPIADNAQGDLVIDGDRIVVRLPEAAVFEGKGADISEAGEATLKALGAVVKSHEGVRATLIAHLDGTPVPADLRDLFPTSWELCGARATNSVRFLQDEAGVPAGRLVGAAGGEHHRVVSSHVAQRRLDVEIGPE